MPISVAEMTEEPTPTPLARPDEPAALLMLATAEVADAQVTWVVRVWVVRSE